MSPNLAGVYALRNRVNGKDYIGSSVAIPRRWKAHRALLRVGRHHSPKLQAAWSKHGESAFEFCVLIRCAPTAVLLYEDIALRAFDAVASGYNIATKAGSRLGVPHSEAARAKISAAGMGRAPMRGRKHSAETKQKMSAARKGHRQPQWTAEQRAAYYASRKSPYLRAKLSAAMRGNKNGSGRKQSPETIAAMQAGRARQREAARAAKARI